jgi:hypothetical protein
MRSGGVRARLSDQALQAVRTTVRLIRRSEREDEDPRACSDAQLSALELLFRQIPAQDLQAVIRRHRLECFLQRDPLTARLMPELMAMIRFHARQETLAALALVSLLRVAVVQLAPSSRPSDRRGLHPVLQLGVILHFIFFSAVNDLSELSCDLIIGSQDKSFVEFALSENSLRINTHFN